jgi:hypothetical protein
MGSAMNDAQPCDAADARLQRFDPLKIIAASI